MSKTLHKKHTDKQVYHHFPTLTYPAGDYMLTGMVEEMKILNDAAKDLLQPRREAVDAILRMSRAL